MMDKETLKRIVEEVIDQKLNEREIEDPELEAQIEEFARLSDRLDKLKGQVREEYKKYKELQSELAPLLEEMKETEEIALRTKKHIVTIKRAAYTSPNYKWKKGYKLLYSKVNHYLKEMGDELIESTKTISKVATSLAVQDREDANETNVNENVLSRLWKKFRMYMSRLVGRVSSINDKLRNTLNQFESQLSK